MRVEDAIKQRRSIRQYTDEIPKDEDIKSRLMSWAWEAVGYSDEEVTKGCRKRPETFYL